MNNWDSGADKAGFLVSSDSISGDATNLGQCWLLPILLILFPLRFLVSVLNISGNTIRLIYQCSNLILCPCCNRNSIGNSALFITSKIIVWIDNLSITDYDCLFPVLPDNQ